MANSLDYSYSAQFEQQNPAYFPEGGIFSDAPKCFKFGVIPFVSSSPDAWAFGVVAMKSLPGPAGGEQSLGNLWALAL